MTLRSTSHYSSSHSPGSGKKARIQSRVKKVPSYSPIEYPVGGNSRVDSSFAGGVDDRADGGQASNMNPVNLRSKRQVAGKIVCLGIALLVVFCAVLAGVEVVLNSGKVHYGVTVEGVDIGGMTEQEAAAALEAVLSERFEGVVFVVTVDADTRARLEGVASESGEAADAAAESPDEAAETEEVVEAATAATQDFTSSAVYDLSNTSTLRAADEDNSDAAAESSDVDDADGEDASTEDGASLLTWEFTPEELGMTTDVDTLVEQALSVGYPDDWNSILSSIRERFFCWLDGVELSADEAFIFDEELLASAMSSMNDVLGVSMVNCSIIVDAEGIASVASGCVGEQVDQEAFEIAAVAAVLGKASASFDISMEEVPLAIDEEKAQAAADFINEALALPVTLEYKEQTWELTAAQMGAWVSTEISGEGDETQLVVSLDRVAAYEGIQEILGSVGYGTAVNASFDVRSGTPVITGGTSGIGPDISAGVTDLEELLFGGDEDEAAEGFEDADDSTDADSDEGAGEDGAAADGEDASADTTDDADLAESRTIVLEEGIVLPEITIEDAAEMGINELIASYTITYDSGSSARASNIKLCLDAINGTLLAPGEIWDWNSKVGLCDESTGYKVAPAVVSGNVVQTAGGGIDDVATCLFNAVYEAGLAIGERTSLSMLQLHYPVGRDAMVAWGSSTLSFTNDTENYLLIVVSYDGTNLEVGIWGTDEGRTVKSSFSDWGISSSGYSLTNYRTVYAADASVLHQDSFSSYYLTIEQEEEEDEQAEEAGSSQVRDS